MKYKLENTWDEAMIVYLYASNVRPLHGVPDMTAITLKPRESRLVEDWQVSAECRVQERIGHLYIVGVQEPKQEKQEEQASLSEDVVALIKESEQEAIEDQAMCMSEEMEEAADPTLMTSAVDVDED